MNIRKRTKVHLPRILVLKLFLVLIHLKPLYKDKSLFFPYCFFNLGKNIGATLFYHISFTSIDTFHGYASISRKMHVHLS